MEGYSERRIRAYIITGIVIACLLAGLSFFLVYQIMYKAKQEDPEPVVDIVDVLLQDDLGINANDYESRPLYTKDHWENDLYQIKYGIENRRYDMIETLAKDRYANFKFEGEYLNLISTLRNVEVMDLEDEEYDKEDRLLWLSKISDIELFLLMFLTLPYKEQCLYVGYPNVNMIPALEYQSIEITYHTEANDISRKIIGFSPFYEVVLSAKYKNVIVYLLNSGSCNIFYVNNEQHNMNGMTYN